MRMNVRVRAALLVVLLAGASTGCVMYGRPRVGVVYVATRPPVERVEVIPAPPGVGFVWIKGYYAYRGTEFLWMPGRYERPVAGMREWVPHHWEHDRNGWYLVEGHWR